MKLPASFRVSIAIFHQQGRRLLSEYIMEASQEHKNADINLVREQIMVMLARVCGIKWQDGWISHELEGFVSMQS